VNEAFYLQTRRVEDRHWWFRSRRRLVDGLLAAEKGRTRLARALDVGCGSGGNLPLLARHSAEVIGLDRAWLALRLARERSAGARLVQGDANFVGRLFPPQSFDLVTIFNVLYHRWIRDERDVLDQLARLLRPGGLLVLTEPAFPLLFRRHDVLDFGRRRYRLAPLRGLVRASGLELRRSSYFNLVAFPPAVALACIRRITERGRKGGPGDGDLAELSVPPGALNRLLLGVMRLESAWILGVSALPLGVGVILFARKPAGTGRGERQVRM
jgi:SAM-dependent methyltransferase